MTRDGSVHTQTICLMHRHILVQFQHNCRRHRTLKKKTKKYPCGLPPTPGDRHLATVSPPPIWDTTARYRGRLQGGAGYVASTMFS